MMVCLPKIQWNRKFISFMILCFMLIHIILKFYFSAKGKNVVNYSDVRKRASEINKAMNNSFYCLYEEESHMQYRDTKGLKILEIGTNCDLEYEGVSFEFWSSNFHDAQTTFLIKNVTCGEGGLESFETILARFGRKIDKIPMLTIVDQNDSAFFKKVAWENGPWDIIIDNSCHTYSCNFKIFWILFESLNPGGAYVMKTRSTWQNWSSFETMDMISEVYTISPDKDEEESESGSFLDSFTCCNIVCALYKSRPRISSEKT